MSADHDPQRVAEAIREQLKDLQLDYVDLYLLHWPLSPPFQVCPSTLRGRFPRDVPGCSWALMVTNLVVQGTWRAMEKLVDEGLVKSIGLSNFSVKKLKDVQSWARIQPAVNQVSTLSSIGWTLEHSWRSSLQCCMPAGGSARVPPQCCPRQVLRGNCKSSLSIWRCAS